MGEPKREVNEYEPGASEARYAQDHAEAMDALGRCSDAYLLVVPTTLEATQVAEDAYHTHADVALYAGACGISPALMLGFYAAAVVVLEREIAQLSARAGVVTLQPYPLEELGEGEG